LFTTFYHFFLQNFTINTQLYTALQTKLQKNNSETAKSFCINFWSAQEKIDALSKYATLSEQCKCTQDEMNYSVTDDLATRVIEMQIQANNSEVQYLSEEVGGFNAVIASRRSAYIQSFKYEN
jgi:hypothetical protein